MKKLLVLLAILSTKFAAADMPATHGMLLFGNKQTYASHLPMFHTPHDYQLIMEIEVNGYPRSMAAIYYNDEKKAGTKLFTLEPEKMDLTKIIDGSKKTFKANVYKGHFEKDGVNLGPATIEVKKVVFTKKLNANESNLIDSSIGSINKHILFGENGEYYAAHVIEGFPSYDAVYSVSNPIDNSVGTNACTSRNCNKTLLGKLIPDSLLPLFTKDYTAQLPTPAEKGTALGKSNNSAIILEVLYAEVDELSR